MDTMEKRMLIECLHAGRTYVDFTKTNGEFRKLKCTLNPELLPVDVRKKLEEDEQKENTRKYSPDVVRVYDIENNGWRSFRYDSVITFGTDL